MSDPEAGPLGPLAKACKNHEARQRLVEICTRANKEKAAIAVGTRLDRPLYQLRGASIVDARELEASLEVGADEFRRHWPLIRSMVRALGLRFALMLRGRAIAVLERHPSYDTGPAERFLSMARQRRLLERESELVTRLARVDGLPHEKPLSKKRRENRSAK